LSPLLY